MDVRVNFSGRSIKYTENEINVVVKAMNDAEPLTQSGYRNEFEKKFAEYIGVDGNCFTVSNATGALEMTAQLCQFKEGDEVIIPSHTFTASAYPFVKKGAKLVWADIDPDTFTAGLEEIKAKYTSKTKAVIVVHLYGYAVDTQPIADWCNEKGIILIEDAAQSIGASVNGKKTGTFGDFGVFSLHSHKNITTLGEGGILYVKDQDKADLIPMLRHNGHCGFDFERKDYWLPAMGNVDLPELNGEYIYPNNYCLGEIECALGIELLKRVDQINDEKRKRAIRFIDELKDFPQLKFLREDTVRHNYHLLVAKVINGKRDEMMRKMYENGVKCVIQYYPLNRYDFYKKAGFGEADCPNTDDFYDNMISFPFQHWLSDDDYEYMLKTVKKVLTELG